MASPCRLAGGGSLRRSRSDGPCNTGDGVRTLCGSEAHARAGVASVGRRTVGGFRARRSKSARLPRHARGDPGRFVPTSLRSTVRIGLAGVSVPPSKVTASVLLHAATSRWRPCRSRSLTTQLQDTSASEERCDLLCSRGLSRLLGAAGRQVRDRRRGICCEGRCAELRHAEAAPARRSSTPPNDLSFDARATRRRRHRGFARASPQLVKRAVSAKVQTCDREPDKSRATTEPQRPINVRAVIPRRQPTQAKRKTVVCLCAAQSMSLTIMPVAGHRQNAKTCAKMSAGREGTRQHDRRRAR